MAQDYQDRRTGPGHKYKDMSCSSQLTFPSKGTDACVAGSLTTSYVVSRQANQDVTHGHLYELWDANKIQGCKCDQGYTGPDCGNRVPPKGSDALSTIKSNSMKQLITIGPASGSPTFEGQEFIMTYPDPYGGMWRTDAIVATSNDALLATRVQNALRKLPNEVLEGVKVTAAYSANPKICHRFRDGQDHLSAFENYHVGHGKEAKYKSNFCKFASTSVLGKSASKMDFEVTFSDRPGQSGVQYLFEVDITPRGPGHFPVSAGVTESGTVVSVAEINYNENLHALSEGTECSDRGLDDGDGQCECFAGFGGYACQNIEALV